MIVKKKSKVTKALIAASFLIGIIAIFTPVIAANSNRVFFMAIGDDLDIPGANNLIIGKIKFSGGDELPSARVFFHSKIYDESGEKVYAMKGMLKNGSLLTRNHYFLCPLFNVWFVNVWWVMGEGKFKTTDTVIEVIFRGLFPITMPNTEGKYVSAQILMFLSPTAEYYEVDLNDPMNPATIPWDEEPLIWEGGGWALAAVIWEFETPMGPMVLPIGPLSYLTISIGI